MLNRLPAIAAAILVASLSVPAFAQSTSQGMSHDTMGHSTKTDMGHMGSMDRHDTMGHDSMGKGAMAHGTMSSGAMSHDTNSNSQ